MSTLKLKTSKLDYSPLILGSIQSIRIPLIRHQTENQQQNESDLTELSWLTNNMLNTNSNSIQSPKPKTSFSLTNSKTLNKQLNNRQSVSNKVYQEASCLSPDSPLSSSSSSSSSSSCSISPCLSPCSACHTTELAKLNSKKFLTKNKSALKTKKSSQTTDASTSSITNLPPLAPQFKNTSSLTKPPLTLSCLIFMALEESKDKCLPVREIYEWIENNFSFYKTSENSGWKSSIRHNLSFSKCFKKMDRNESVLYRLKAESSLNNDLGRKRRAPNSVGTCWKVNEECKAYLIQMLKKSNFWYHNSNYYASLANYIDKFDLAEIKNIHHSHHDNLNSNKRVKKEVSNEESSSDEMGDLGEYNSNLLEFVKKQQEMLVEQVNLNLKEKEEPKELDLSLSASSASLSSAFSSLSWSFKGDDDSSSKRLKTVQANSNEILDLTAKQPKLSSELEMEVASTLVDMKWFASRNLKI